MAPTGLSVAGKIHEKGFLRAFEFDTPAASSPPQNIILFIGGLYDGLFSVSYPAAIAKLLPSSWCIAQILLSSSGIGWGTSSLAKDVSEISEWVAYFRELKGKPGKVVLMGSSTGCQDVMEYLTGAGSRIEINGGILQAPVSDREVLVELMSPGDYTSICEGAKRMFAEGNGEEIMPGKLLPAAAKEFFFCPITANRCLSLLSPDHNGADDYFSSDLTDEQLSKTFGALPKTAPICVLFSGEDEFMPKRIDKEKLLSRWEGIVAKGEGVIVHSSVVQGASHNLNGNPESVLSTLIERVAGFVEGLSSL